MIYEDTGKLFDYFIQIEDLEIVLSDKIKETLKYSIKFNKSFY